LRRGVAIGVQMVWWKRAAKIGGGALALALLPTQIGLQDLSALLVHQPGVMARAREHLIASPFGTIHAAMFSLPRPLGTAIPHPPVYTLANFDPAGVADAIGQQLLGDSRMPLQFPTINRTDKRDSLLTRKRTPLPPLPPVLPIRPVPQAGADVALAPDTTAGRIDPYSDYDFPASIDASGRSTDRQRGTGKNLAVFPQEDREGSADRVYFGGAPIGPRHEALRPWSPGEAPVVVASGDPDIKQSALSGEGQDDKPGVTVAGKGVVTGEDARPKSPAERLGLAGPARARAEKCLANAVYFESRDEPVRAQIAVAQVVLNRVFSPFYPNDVCGVVYQNANRHLACQFTFACDGTPDVVTEPDAWARAKHIASDMLAGKLWMPEVAKSTHYHDSWAHPNWVGEMRRIDRLGGLIFYRPRAWGDGADEPSWGDPKTTAKEAAKL